jgi:hypothetical protein
MPKASRCEALPDICRSRPLACGRASRRYTAESGAMCNVVPRSIAIAVSPSNFRSATLSIDTSPGLSLGRPEMIRFCSPIRISSQFAHSGSWTATRSTGVGHPAGVENPRLPIWDLNVQ